MLTTGARIWRQMMGLAAGTRDESQKFGYNS
jgi:hypothetical protein